jgi:hypothetical protein
VTGSHTRFATPAGYHAQTAPFQVFWTLDMVEPVLSYRFSFWVGAAW